MADTLTRISVQGTFEDPNNPAAQLEGQQIVFTASVGRLVNDTGAVIGVPRAITSTLDATGAFSISLVATDSPHMQPQNWTYIVTDPFGTLPYPIAVPANSPGGVLDLSSVIPAAAVSGGTVQLLTGRGIASVAINGSSHLIVTFTDGSTTDLGVISGGGGGGADGVGVATAALDINGHLIITLTDATVIDVGLVVGGTDVTAASPIVFNATTHVISAPSLQTATVADGKYAQFAAVTGGWKFTGGSGKTFWVTSTDPDTAAANGDVWVNTS